PHRTKPLRRAWIASGTEVVMKRTHVRLVALSILVALAAPCLATGPQPTEWPLDRIIANLEERLRVAPDDSLAHYNLGRAHAFAFALERSSLWAVDERPHLADPSTDRGVEVEDLEDQRKLSATTSLGPSELLAHLAEGVRHLRRACEIDEPDVWWRIP